MECDIGWGKWLKVAERGIISHGYIIDGGSKTLRDEFAGRFIEKMISRGISEAEIKNVKRRLSSGNYADIHHLYPEGILSIKKEQVEKLQRDMCQKPMEGSYKFAVIHDSEKLTVEGQNSLLKTLEEPDGQGIIFLLTDSRVKLLDTIRSRCQNISLGEPIFFTENAMNSEEYKWMEQVKDLCDLMREAKFFYKTKEKAMELAKSREDVLELLDGMEAIVAKDFTSRPLGDVSNEIEAIEDARKYISKGYSISYGMGTLIIKFGGIDD